MYMCPVHVCLFMAKVIAVCRKCSLQCNSVDWEPVLIQQCDIFIQWKITVHWLQQKTKAFGSLTCLGVPVNIHTCVNNVSKKLLPVHLYIVHVDPICQSVSLCGCEYRAICMERLPYEESAVKGLIRVDTLQPGDEDVALESLLTQSGAAPDCQKSRILCYPYLQILCLFLPHWLSPAWECEYAALNSPEKPR